MPVSIIHTYGEYDSVMLEAYSPHGYGNTTPYLYADRHDCPNTVALTLNCAPSGILADSIEEEMEHMTGYKITEIVHYLRTGEHAWGIARVITSLHLRDLDGRNGYTPFTVREVERQLAGTLDRLLRGVNPR